MSKPAETLASSTKDSIEMGSVIVFQPHREWHVRAFPVLATKDRKMY
jgi:hypothetical protein